MTVRFSQLENGFRVVSQAMPHAETSSLGVWIKAGSRQEGPGENGIAHLLEHMAFKGTKNRTALQIVEEIEQVGGDLNASTGLDQTSYYAQVLGSSIDVAVELLADIILNPLHRADDLAQEANVIAQEIMAAREQGEELIFDQMMSRAFPGQAVGRPVMGTLESVRQITSDDLFNFMDKHYRAGQMVLVGAGAVEHQALHDLAQRYFGVVPGGPTPVLVPARYEAGFLVEDRPFEQVHAVVGFEGVGFCSDDIFTAQILNSALGGGMSSRLFQQVREARGLAYHVYSFHSAFEDCGFLGAYAASDPQRADEMIDVLLCEIRGLGHHGLSQREIDRAKAQLRCGAAMVMESASARAEQLARQILFFDQVFERETLIARLEAVTMEDCYQFVESYIMKGQLSLAVMGAGLKKGGFERFIEPWQRTYSGSAAVGSTGQIVV